MPFIPSDFRKAMARFATGVTVVTTVLDQTYFISLLAQILHNLPSGTRALPGSAFHKALELDRAMFAREVDRPLARALVAAEVRVLLDTPARVTAQKIGVASGVAQRSSTRPCRYSGR